MYVIYNEINVRPILKFGHFKTKILKQHCTYNPVPSKGKKKSIILSFVLKEKLHFIFKLYIHYSLVGLHY